MKTSTFSKFFESFFRKFFNLFLTTNVFSKFDSFEFNSKNSILSQQKYGKMKHSLILSLMLFLFSNFLVAQITIDGQPSDWPAALNSGAISAKVFVHDPNNTDDNQFTGGSSDGGLISTWAWTYGQTNNKGDISNSGAVIIGNNLYFFGDRTAINGDAQIGFWFFLGGVTPSGDGISGSPFLGEHQIGDILVLSNFTNGGGVVQLRIYRWVGSGGSDGSLDLVAVTFDAAVNATNQLIPASGPFTASSNGSIWTYQGNNVPSEGTPPPNTYHTGAFFEGSINLTQNGLNACFASFLLETRNSQSVSASLQDFTGGVFNARPLAPIAVPASRCGTGTVSLTATGCLGTLKWYAAASGGTSLFTGLTFVPSISTTTSYWVSCTNDLGCEGPRTEVVVTVNSNPTATAGPDDAKCQTAPSGPTSFTLAGTSSNGTSAWTQVGQTGTAQATVATPGSPTSTVSVAGTGTVTLRITTTSNTTPSCGSVFDEVTLRVNANPIATAGPDDAKCQTAPSGPTSFTLAGTSSNGTSAWTQVGQTGTAQATVATPGSPTSTVSVAGTGTVTLRITTTSNTTPSCGSVFDEVTLRVNANPTATAGPDDAKCQTAPSGPTSFTLAGTSSNGTSAWTQVGQTGTAQATVATPGSPTSTVNVAGIGTVTLRITTTSSTTPSCGSVFDEVTLRVNELTTTTDLTPAERCANSTQEVTFETTASGTEPFTYVWKKDNVVIVGANDKIYTVVGPITSAKAGNYSVDVTGACGTASQNADLTVNPLPLLVLRDITVCLPLTVDLTLPALMEGSTLPSGTIFTYWADAAATNSQITLANAQAYAISGVVYIKATTTSGCVDIKPLTVTIEPCGGPLCTYTQGYYGGSGTACTAEGEFSSIEVITNSINNMPGDVLYIGKGANAAAAGGSFTVTAAQAANLNALMPGGGSAIILGGDYTPFNIQPLQNNRIKNVLLGQTVAMALNLYLTSDPDDSIGNFSLVGSGGKYVVTKARAEGSSCADPVKADCLIQPNAIESYLMPFDVIAALPADADVWDLFQMAKNVLGGDVYPNVSLSEVVDALKAINNGFDKCRYFIEFADAATLCPPIVEPVVEPVVVGKSSGSTQSGDEETVATAEKGNLNLSFEAYPIPFRDQLTIKYKFDYDSEVKIELFNSQGFLIYSKEDNNSYFGKEMILNLYLNNRASQMYIVKLTTNKGSSFKKVISAR